jgi:hypothetical protein
MSNLETRTGYGDHHHKVCMCEDCGTDRLIAGLTSRLWTAADPEDLGTPALGSVSSMRRLTVPDWHPELRAEVNTRMAFDAAVDDVFDDFDDLPWEWTR